MLLSHILYEGEYASEAKASAVSFSSIVTDTAELTRDCLFVCLSGQHVDSHNLVPLVAASGAAAIIAEEGKTVNVFSDTPVFYVSDTHEFLSRLFYRYYDLEKKNSRLIAVTGTNGKTSTAFILAAILSGVGASVGLIGTVDILLNGKPLPLTKKEAAATKTMTTPDPHILYPIISRMADAGADYIVMEASSHALALKKLAPLHFSLGLFTNLSPEHLDFHRDMEAYLAAKASLFPLCRLCVLNALSPYSAEILDRTDANAVLAGTEEACLDVLDRLKEKRRQKDTKAYTLPKLSIVDSIELCGSHGSSFTLIFENKMHAFQTKLAGMYNAENAYLAITAALSLGISAKSAALALADFSHIPGRLERLTAPDADFSVFIDYAHTEAAMRRLLDTVRQFRLPNERIVLLFGCGGDRDKSKRAPMGTVAETLADFSIVTSDNPRTESPTAIIQDILRGMPNKAARRVIVNREHAIFYVIEHAKKGDIILLIGKGHESYEIVKSGPRPFDEKRIVEAALAARNKSPSGHT